MERAFLLAILLVVLLAIFGVYILTNIRTYNENSTNLGKSSETTNLLQSYPKENIQLKQGEHLRFYSNGCSTSIYFSSGSKDEVTNKLSARFSYAPGGGFDIAENEEETISSEQFIWFKNESKPSEGRCEVEENQLDKKKITIIANELHTITIDYGGKQFTSFEGNFTVKYN